MIVRWLVLTCTLLILSPVHAQDTHPFRLEDMLALEAVTKAVPSPDGTHFALTRQRPRTEGEVYGRTYRFSGERSDVWLITADGASRNLTEGGATGASYWSPVWSPDGARLALLADEGDGFIRVYLWDAATDTLTRLTRQSVDPEFNAGGTSMGDRVAVLWVDETRLLTSLVPEGALPFVLARDGLAAESILPHWQAAREGRESTASLLSGGAEAEPESELVLLDVTSGEARLLARGAYKLVSLAPDRRHAALLSVPESVPPSPDTLIAYPPDWNAYAWAMRTRSRLELLSLDDENIMVVEGVPDPFRNALPRWAADGSTFSVVAGADPTRFLVSATGEIESVTDGAGEAVLVDGQLFTFAGDAWHGVDGSRIAGPRELLMTRDGGAVGVAEGELYALEEGAFVSLTEAFEPQLEAVVWPRSAAARVDEVLLATAEGWYRATLSGAGAELTPLQLPHENASLLAYAPESGTALFQVTGADGTTVYVGDPATGTYAESFSLNTHLASVAELETQLIDYRHADGEALKGLLLLPAAREEGERVPLVTFVYPGFSVYDETSGSSAFAKDAFMAWHLQNFTSHGYAVLLASVPIAPGADPLFEIPKGVLPAVDEAVRLGVADPQRLGLFGHSFGGYAVLGLLTQTGRFQAAVAVAPIADLALYHSGLGPLTRYQPNAQALSYNSMAELEDGGLAWSLGADPYRDFERYRRNSPVAYLDAVTTPVLLVHGDLDPVVIQHSESVYMGLHRLGKPVALLRYFGEGHNLSSPANIRDLWVRMLDWYDRAFGGP